jgi:hypothetical protein
MKEANRQRITRCLEQVAAWRASGMSIEGYAESIGQSPALWRGWVTWETRWRQMLAADGGSAQTAFVQVRGPKRGQRQNLSGTAEYTHAAPTDAAHIALILSHPGKPLGVRVQWPLHAAAQSAAWLREVLA